jgi:DNA-directed RNA polymerase specialized sigma24 family protein
LTSLRDPSLLQARIIVERHGGHRAPHGRGQSERLRTKATKLGVVDGLESHHLAIQPPDEDLEALDEALSKLAVENPQVAALVQLRFFVGLTLAQSADVLGISERTADSWWAYGRAWLAVKLKGS